MMNPPTYNPRALVSEILEILVNALHDEFAVDSPAIEKAIREIYGAVENGDDQQAIALLEALPKLDGFPTDMLWAFLDLKQDMQMLEIQTSGDVSPP
jgi:hypothetical protein